MTGTQTQSMAPVVVISNLNKKFTVGSGRNRTYVHAVKDASLAIERGHCLAVVGESGSGKSTLARMLVGLETPDSGSVFLNGKPVNPRTSRRIRRQRSKDVQMVFQDPQGSLNRRLPVSEAVAEVLKAHTSLDPAARRRRCRELFLEVGLTETHMSALPDE